MAAEGSDQVRILDLFVEVADEAAAGQMGRCNFVERTDFLFAGGWIIDYDRTGKSGGKEHLLDGNIVFLLRNQRKEFIKWKVLISLEYFLCDRVQQVPHWSYYHAGSPDEALSDAYTLLRSVRPKPDR